MNFFKKIEEIGRVFLKGPLRSWKKYSKQAAQLLLDKAVGLVYLHKIFQHLSVGVAGKRRRAENLPAPSTARAELLESINNITANRS